MQKLTSILLTSFLVLGTAACSNLNKTSANAGDESSIHIPTKAETKQNLKDAQSQVRRQQLEQDIRAREQRNDLFNHGSANNRSDADLASEVRDKIEANLPSSELSVEAQDGIVTVSGTVTDSQQFNQIKTLATQIKGVRNVNINAAIATIKAK